MRHRKGPAQGYRVNVGPTGNSQHGGGSKFRLAGKQEAGLGREREGAGGGGHPLVRGHSLH